MSNNETIIKALDALRYAVFNTDKYKDDKASRDALLKEIRMITEQLRRYDE